MMTPPEHDAREAVLNARFEAWSTAAAIIVTTIGTAVLVGWALDIEMLKRISPGLRAMNPATAVGFVLSGFSLALLRESRLTAVRRLTAQLLGAGVLLIGLAKIVDVATGPRLQVDRLLFRSAVESPSQYGINDMANTSGVGFVLFGLALVYFAGTSRLSHRLSQIMSVSGTVLAVFPLIGYMYGADSTSGLGAIALMALHTSISFLVLGSGLLIAPGTQAIKLISRADQGGKIVRRLFPTVVITILVLGFLRLKGQQAGWYETEMGAALMVSATIVAMATILWWDAAVISAADRRRLDVEAALHLSESALRAANETLALQVRVDSLTGIGNRMALDEELARAMQTMHRYESEGFSILMIDVDHFKRYNDTFGHLAGDEVLRQVALVLETISRATDIVGRYGGEEFAVILPHTPKDGAREIAERLRLTVERHQWPNAPVTVSVGIATAISSATDADEVLHEADIALYMAKKNGRNRVYHVMDTAELQV